MMLTAELTELIDSTSLGVARAYRVERDDVAQEMWAWALEHERSIERNLDSDNAWRVSRGLWGAGKRFALAERAARSGYSLDDLYFYDPATIAETLPFVFGFDSPLDVVLAPKAEDRPRIHEDEFAVRMADVGSALLSIPPVDREFLKTVIRCGHDWDIVGETLDILPKSARNRWTRIIKRLQKALGGADPWHRGDRTGTRRVISNAKARAITGMDRDGEA